MIKRREKTENGKADNYIVISGQSVFDGCDELYYTSCVHYATNVYNMILGNKIKICGGCSEFKDSCYIEGKDSNTGKNAEYLEYIPIFEGEDNALSAIDPTSPNAEIKVYPGDILLNSDHAMIYLGKNVVLTGKDEEKNYKSHASGPNKNIIRNIFEWDIHANEGGNLEWYGIVRVREGAGDELDNIPYETAISNKTNGMFKSYLQSAVQDFQNEGGPLTEVIYDDETIVSKYNIMPQGTQVDEQEKDKFKFSFSAVIDKILGIMLLIPKVIIIGYTGLMQKFVVTDLVNAVTGTSLVGNLTVEKIIFNEVPLLDINFFNITPEFQEEQPVIYIIRENIRSWYNGIRYLGIAGMLIVLLYIGIRMTITSVAEEKGKYKAMLKDWLISFLMLFVIHYIMIGIITLNEQIIGFFTKGGANESSLFDQILVRAYDLRLSVGLPATAMYVILVVFTILYLFAYLKRFFTVAILTIFAPIVAVSYAIDKVKDGKSQTYSLWLKEYIYNVLIQSIHVVIYTVFIGTSIEMALTGMTTNDQGEVLEVSSVWNALIANMVPAIVFMLFSLRLDKLFKQIFTFSDSKTQDDIPSSFEEIASAAYVAKNTSMGVLKTGAKLAVAPVTLPVKALSKVTGAFDLRSNHRKIAAPNPVKRTEQAVKGKLQSASGGVKELTNALKQALPQNLGELNSFMMLNKIYDLAKKRKAIRRSAENRI